MGYYLKSGELERIREMCHDPNNRMAEFFHALSVQAQETVGTSILDHVGMEWWYCIDRLPNAAAVYAVEPQERLGTWVHDNVMRIVELPLDAWIGPWHRPRNVPQQGMLETSIICMALTMSVEFTELLYTTEEMARIRQALREKGLCLLLTRLEYDMEHERRVHNQFVQVLAGTAAAAAFLGEYALFTQIKEKYDYISHIYNADSYGEGLNYWEYASQHMVLIREFLCRYDAEMEKQLSSAPYCGSLQWAAASFLHHKHVPGFEDPMYPISLNISDSGYIKRLPAMLLLGIAMDRTRPKDAALARWMFENQYPKGMMTFRTKQMGFMDEISYWCLLFYGKAAEPASPEQIGVPLRKYYENGQFILRSSWQEGSTVLAGMGGCKQLGVSFHRHRDYNSFLLNYRKEMLFVDPGHCCYRLDAFQLIARSTHSHNAVVLKKDGNELCQKRNSAAGDFVNPAEPLCQMVRFDRESNMTVYASDAKNAYDSTVKMAKRTLAMVNPQLIIIRDDIQTDTPVRTVTRFHLNNWNNQLEYELQTDGVSAERNGVKFRLMQLFGNTQTQMTRKWGIMHLSYHPDPNQGCQGKEGSTVDIDFSSQETSCHVAVYAIVLDDGWEVKTEKGGKLFCNGGYRFTVMSDATKTLIQSEDRMVTL